MPATQRFTPTRAQVAQARITVTHFDLFADEPADVRNDLRTTAWAVLHANAVRPTALILRTHTGGDAA